MQVRSGRNELLMNRTVGCTYPQEKNTMKARNGKENVPNSSNLLGMMDSMSRSTRIFFTAILTRTQAAQTLQTGALQHLSLVSPNRPRVLKLSLPPPVYQTLGDPNPEDSNPAINSSSANTSWKLTTSQIGAEIRPPSLFCGTGFFSLGKISGFSSEMPPEAESC